MISALGLSLPGPGRSVRLQLAGYRELPPNASAPPQLEPRRFCSARRRARLLRGRLRALAARFLPARRAGDGVHLQEGEQGRAGDGPRRGGPGSARPARRRDQVPGWESAVGRRAGGLRWAAARRALLPQPGGPRAPGHGPAFPGAGGRLPSLLGSLYNRNMCVNIVITECDFSSLPVYGEYTLRVRAESENEKSDWVNIIFKPLDDTIIGPPDVKVKSESGSLHVDFTGPVAVQELHEWPLNKYYGSWVYRVLYWKKGNSEEVITTDTKYNSEILSGLDPWTIYCLQVQAVIPEWNKTGKLSDEFCDRTTDNGVTPVWIILTVLLVSMLVVLISVPACFFIFSYIYQQARYVFFPTYSFPQHLKEILIPCNSFKLLSA
ncbi:interleukin-10 receptor subunit beta isoform X3 [Mauremys reevesii]|uniref:interleukin-10 receptor subunit beta isoform X3 n=1 Tax=Mauremys reevesii TaxID=260615 RepID=UPI00193FC1BA|nr:interleukin-10 receptor subunit beta isoform X3 [Mauremys reevesii]